MRKYPRYFRFFNSRDSQAERLAEEAEAQRGPAKKVRDSETNSSHGSQDQGVRHAVGTENRELKILSLIEPLGPRTELQREMQQEAIAAVSNLIKRFGIEPFEEIARATGGCAGVVFRYAIPRIAGRILCKDDLFNKDLLIQGLQEARPWVQTHLEEAWGPDRSTCDYNESELHDPDRIIDPVITVLQEAALP